MPKVAQAFTVLQTEKSPKNTVGMLRNSEIFQNTQLKTDKNRTYTPLRLGPSHEKKSNSENLMSHPSNLFHMDPRSYCRNLSRIRLL